MLSFYSKSRGKPRFFFFFYTEISQVAIQIFIDSGGERVMDAVVDDQVTVVIQRLQLFDPERETMPTARIASV